MKSMNQALLAKAGWRLAQREKGLWTSMFQDKYLKRGYNISDNLKTRNCLSTWRGSIQNGSDKVIWGLANDGEFTVKSACEGHFIEDGVPIWSWNFIWNLKLPLGVVHFLWTILHGKLLTNNHRATKGHTLEITCDRCKEECEDNEHVFRGCAKSLDI
ncbi:hypothetical protein Dsin_010014 [Dipteronia sinensis]|uniref:Reverse transcriptase zinc-binding domain-containing protein n=1 Tax=Dipteronia sinensis TaxID=43782 RepID=A0AAE0ASZ5_9ROSI|nr:hypothetical protein Dsin_010014 [Dipteronia sinensis]